MKKQFLNYPYWRDKILPSALQILYRPWLISLGLHGLLLMMPLPDHPLSESPKPLREVKITDLPAPKKSASKPSPKSSAKVSKPTSSRNASIPRQDIDTPLQLSKPTPKPTPSAKPTPKPTPSLTPTPKPTPLETPGVKTIEGGDLEKFLGELTASNEMPANKASNEMPADKAGEARPDLFDKPSLFFDQSNPPKWKSGIRRMVWIDGKTPDQVQKQVQNSQISSGRDFNVIQLEDYGGGKLWEVKQGSKVWYLNLVPTKDTNGTVVVEWKRAPKRPTGFSSKKS